MAVVSLRTLLVDPEKVLITISEGPVSGLTHGFLQRHVPLG
jgi:hypothetical protein